MPEPGAAHFEACRARGLEALLRGEVAFCLLAGGMATRMGGVVKALVEVFGDRDDADEDAGDGGGLSSDPDDSPNQPDDYTVGDLFPGSSFLDLRFAENATFLDLRLAENATISRLAGRRLPLWMMTSEATDGPIREALGSGLDVDYLTTFEQNVSLRLTPAGLLFLDDHGRPSAYATGHGDLPDALERSGILHRFLERGGKTVWIANIDNLGATIDPVILGFHLEHGAPITVEVVDKVGTDRGGVPVRWNGRPIITEEFRLPLAFDPKKVPVFNTNTFLVNAEALASLAMEWTYVEVEKTIGNARAVQFERLMGEMTAALEPRFIRVPRSTEQSRFLPVKDMDELDRRRDDIQAIVRARGML